MDWKTKRLIATASVPVLAYVCAAFVGWQADPSQWYELGRAMLVLMGLGGALIVAIAPIWGDGA
jgi:hypothetical protein